MADLKISQLNELTSVEDNDLVVVVDVSDSDNKKVKKENLIKNVPATNFLVSGTNKILGRQSSGAGNVEEIICTAAGRAILDDNNAQEQRQTLGAVGLDDVQTLSNKNILTSLNTQTGTSYTLTLSDAGKIVLMNNSSANTLTIPTNASVAFPVGTKIMIVKYGTGNTTISPAGGVTLQYSSNISNVIDSQYDSRVIFKIDTNTWLLV